MATVHCIRHPDYKGKTTPVLACKTCCGIFIDEVKKSQQTKTGGFDAYKWMAEKTKSAESKK